MIDAVDEQLRRHLLRSDGQEDVCLATYTVSTGSNRRTFLLQSVVLPTAGDRDVRGTASFSGSYVLRVAAEAKAAGHGLAMLHSHPAGAGWQRLSRTDHDTEQDCTNIADAYTEQPLLGMTLAGVDGTWSARIWARAATKPVWAESVRVVGPKLTVSWNDGLRPPPPRTRRQVRTVSAWGPVRQDVIARLRVLVVGLGSVGLDVAQRLAATGITDISVMDDDVVEDLNLDRMIGATRSDARHRRLKVDVAHRLMQRAATADKPRFNRFPISVCTPEGLAHTLDHDVVVSCVDRPWPRAVLNTIAYADLVPVIDGGLALETLPNGEMRSGSWRAHTLVSGRPCMMCTHQITHTDVQLDRQGLLDDPTYIERSGREPVSGAPNVAAYSASVSAALLAQFVSLTVHPGGLGVPPPLRYLLATHTLDRLTDITSENCQFELDTALGDGRTPLIAPGSATLATESPTPGKAMAWLLAVRMRIASTLRNIADSLD